MKTTKQIADALGVDKQRVYRYIKRNQIEETHQDSGVLFYDEAAESAIKQGLKQNTDSQEPRQAVASESTIDTLIAILQKELEVKNKQIEGLNEALLNAQRQGEAAQALHAGTMQTQLVESAAPVAGPDKPAKKGLFEKLFKKPATV